MWYPLMLAMLWFSGMVIMVILVLYDIIKKVKNRATGSGVTFAILFFLAFLAYVIIAIVMGKNGIGFWEFPQLGKIY